MWLSCVPAEKLVCRFLLFLPRALSAPRSAALASTHTELTICPPLLFGARQMEEKKSQKNKPVPLIFFSTHKYNLLRRLMSRFIFCHVTLQLNELKIHSLELASQVLVKTKRQDSEASSSASFSLTIAIIRRNCDLKRFLFWFVFF